MARNIVYEPSTLVYTLLDDTQLSFDDMYLYLRWMHRMGIKKFVPHPESKTVHVQLEFQASVANFQEKLGIYAKCVGVSKLSNFIKEDEYARLEQLIRANGLRPGDSPSAQSSSGGSGRKRRNKQAVAIFPPRPAPYPKSTKSASEIAPPIIEIPDEQGHTEECDATYYTYTGVTEKRNQSKFRVRDVEEDEQQVSE